jgi:7-cyano-7-deazaguanine synthase in queuosine biosynthesis
MKKDKNESVEEIRRRVQEGQKNYKENTDIVEGILLKERGYIFRKPIDEDVILLCSGGLDSTVAFDMVIREWNSTVVPVFFKRGARAETFEETAFDYFVNFFMERFPKNVYDPEKIELSIPDTGIKRYLPEEMTLTVGHPLRNSTMQNRAIEHAVAMNYREKLEIRTILSCSVAEDGTEPELGILSLRTQNLNTCVNMGDWRWQISSPLTEPALENRPIYKTDLIKYARKYDIPLERTRTCFSDEEVADGTCFACVKRLKAFKYLGIKDALQYQVRV